MSTPLIPRHSTYKPNCICSHPIILPSCSNISNITPDPVSGQFSTSALDSIPSYLLGSMLPIISLLSYVINFLLSQTSLPHKYLKGFYLKNKTKNINKNKTFLDPSFTSIILSLFFSWTWQLNFLNNLRTLPVSFSYPWPPLSPQHTLISLMFYCSTKTALTTVNNDLHATKPKTNFLFHDLLFWEWCWPLLVRS